MADPGQIRQGLFEDKYDKQNGNVVVCKSAHLDPLPELARWADQVCALGDPTWYAVLVGVLREHLLRVSEGLAWGVLAPDILPCGLRSGDQARLSVSLPAGPVFDLIKI